MDEDVRVERESVLQDKTPSNTAVVVNRLTKRYNDGGCTSAIPYTAVDELCLSIQSDTVLCLLGPNGAGKTTSIHMLVGFHEASAGEASVYGHSIIDNMPEVQRMIGLCPQFDILWK